MTKHLTNRRQGEVFRKLRENNWRIFNLTIKLLPCLHHHFFFLNILNQFPSGN